MRSPRHQFVLPVAVLLTFVLVGCGGGGSETATVTVTEQAGTGTTTSGRPSTAGTEPLAQVAGGFTEDGWNTFREYEQRIEWGEQLTGLRSVVCATLQVVGERTKTCWDEMPQPFAKEALPYIDSFIDNVPTLEGACRQAAMEYTDKRLDESDALGAARKAGMAQNMRRYARATRKVSRATRAAQGQAKLVAQECGPSGESLDTSQPVPTDTAKSAQLSAEEVLGDASVRCTNRGKDPPSWAAGPYLRQEGETCKGLGNIARCMLNASTLSVAADCPQSYDLERSVRRTEAWRRYERCLDRSFQGCSDKSLPEGEPYVMPEYVDPA